MKTHKNGFALVSVISLIVLLALVAVALLTLSSVSSRTSSSARDVQVARENARLGLFSAIGDLQKLAGPDTRVTAPADAVADGGVAAPQQLTGVWRSWEGRNHNTNGLPTAPNYGSKLTTGDPDPTNTASAGRFLGWLISGTQQDNAANSPPSLAEGEDTIPLLSEGTLSGTGGMEVHIAPTPVGTNGGMAWWVQGENTKALMKESEATPSNDAEWSRKLASNGRPDTDLFGFNDDTELSKVYTRKSMDIADNDTPFIAGSNFHNMTAYSRGLLTNTANGGWRRDLSLMGEKWLSGSFIPNNVFSVSPTAELSRSLTLETSPTDGSLYPWASRDALSMSWNALADFVTLYDRVETNSAGMPYFDATRYISSDNVNIDYQFTRLHLTLGYAASEVEGQDPNTPDYQKLYTPKVVWKPTLTYWNPYNVAVENPKRMEVNMPHSELSSATDSLPINITFEVDDGTGTSHTPNLAVLTGNNLAYKARVLSQPTDSDDQTWKPGETRTYSLRNSDFVDIGSGDLGDLNNSITYGSAWYYLHPGYEALGGYMRPLFFKESNETSYSAIATANYTANWAFKSSSSGVLKTKITTSPKAVTGVSDSDVIDLSSNMSSPISEIQANLTLPALANSTQTLEKVSVEPEPFLNIIYTKRLLSESNFQTKGYINTKPITNYGEQYGDTSFYQSSYEWLFESASNWNDASTPETSPTASYGVDHGGFVGTDFDSTGITRWPIAELPTQPLLSLCELQHFDAAYNNPIAPRVSNAIGNSHATPDISSNSVSTADIHYEKLQSVATDSTSRLPDPPISMTGAGYDHSYVGNHILFDDWFISSITPELDNYSSSLGRDINTVYADHLSGVTPLRNSQYIPANFTDSPTASAVTTSILSDNNVWRNIASELEVEGMFNVNSTSTAAWEALLRSQRGSSTPTLSIGNGQDDWNVGSISGSNTPVSRTTVAADPATGGNAATVAVTESAQLTDAQITALATEIVDQIKLRGPFLSLSEFINRQLSADTDLALAGTVEAALIELSKASDNTNPYRSIQSQFPNVGEDLDGNPVGSGRQTAVFTAATIGNVGYGTPGWIRQADVLRPIAPVLSARDDTFTIRAYGEKLDNNGNPTAQAWCEAVVQRKADYIDSKANNATDQFTNLSKINQTLGRKFVIISFRWLNSDEV